MLFSFRDLLPLWGLLLLCACSAPQGELQRLIEDPSPPPLQPLQISLSHVIVEELFDSPLPDGEGEPWARIRPRQDETWNQPVVRSSEGLVLPIPEGGVYLEREYPETLQGLDFLTIELAQEIEEPPSGRLRLEWRSEGESFHHNKSLNLFAENVLVEDGRWIYSFDLSSSKFRRDIVKAVRLRLYLNGLERIVLKRIQGVTTVIDPEQIENTLDRPWSIDLDHEVRSALLSTPRRPIEWPVEVLRGSRLRLGFGVLPGVHHSVNYRIFLRDDQKEVLLSEGSLRSNQWKDLHLEMKEKVSGEAVLRFETDSEGRDQVLAAWAHPTLIPPLRRKREQAPDIVLISADTLRADGLSIYSGGKTTSPAIDAWARRSGVLFEQAVVGASWTLPSHASMLTGIHPLRHGVNYHQLSVPNELNLLPEILFQEGYATAAVTGGGFLHPRFGFQQGFERYFYWPERRAEGELEEVMRRARNLLRTAKDQPLFLFLHTYEVHGPYHDNGVEAKDPYAKIFLTTPPVQPPNFRFPDQYFSHLGNEPVPPERLSTVRKLYDSGVSRLDQELKTILAQARQRESLTILTSDHGEALGENNQAGHGDINPGNLMVPMILALPDGRAAGRRISRQVRSIDLVPSILDLLDLSPIQVDGRSFLPLLDNEHADFPREAWSYAPSRNQGLAVKIDGEEELRIFDNTAWISHRFPSDEEMLSGWQKKALSMLNEARSGLRVDVCNATNVPFKAAMAGRAVNVNGVKSTDDVSSWVEWVRRGKFRLHVPPQTKSHLILEKWTGEPIEIRIGGEIFTDLSSETSITLVENRWKVIRESLPCETGIYLTGTGVGDGKVEMDDALRDQLKALGYLQ